MTSTRSPSYFPPAEGSLFHLDEFEHHTEVHQGEIGDATVRRPSANQAKWHRCALKKHVVLQGRTRQGIYTSC